MSFTIVTLLNIILSDQWCVLPQYSSGLWFHSFYVSKFQISSVHVRDGRHRTIVVNIAFLSSQFYLSVWYMAYELFLKFTEPLKDMKETPKRFHPSRCKYLFLLYFFYFFANSHICYFTVSSEPHQCNLHHSWSWVTSLVHTIWATGCSPYNLCLWFTVLTFVA